MNSPPVVPEPPRDPKHATGLARNPIDSRRYRRPPEQAPGRTGRSSCEEAEDGADTALVELDDVVPVATAPSRQVNIAWRSRHRPMKRGGRRGIRTPDIFLVREALYR